MAVIKRFGLVNETHFLTIATLSPFQTRAALREKTTVQRPLEQLSGIVAEMA